MSHKKQRSLCKPGQGVGLSVKGVMGAEYLKEKEWKRPFRKIDQWEIKCVLTSATQRAFMGEQLHRFSNPATSVVGGSNPKEKLKRNAMEQSSFRKGGIS